MKIKTIIRTTKYYDSIRDNNNIAPNVSEEVLSEYEADNKIANGILEMLDSESNSFLFGEDNNLEVSQYLTGIEERIEKELIIKFIK
jgi:hypothetical protein